MKLALEMHKVRYMIEDDVDDYNSREMKEYFTRLLVAAGFPPSVIDDEEGGEWRYVENDEVVIKQEKLDELRGES